VPVTFPGGLTGILKPFDVAVDAYGTAWFTSNNNNSAIGLAFDGAQVVPMGTAVGAMDGSTIRAPMGIATDSLGNVWVSNSGVIQTPCDTTGIADAATGPEVDDVLGATGASVTTFNAATPGVTATYRDRAGIYLPWGIAVDGLDNVWVANFGGQRLTHLCGARPGSSPGLSVGDAISPAGGYAFTGLVRNTGVQIAPSGNVWVTNNWDEVPVQTNPGGKTVVVFVGLAEPVETPLIGAPSRLDPAP